MTKLIHINLRWTMANTLYTVCIYNRHNFNFRVIIAQECMKKKEDLRL